MCTGEIYLGQPYCGVTFHPGGLAMLLGVVLYKTLESPASVNHF